MKKKKYGYKQGKFTPVNKDKYKGSYPIIYRSSWELQYMMFLDKEPAVLNWGSESSVIIYEDASRKNSKHRYFMDFTMTMRNKDGNIKKYLIEIKPFAQTQPPTQRKSKYYRDKVETYVRNICKWKAAKKIADKTGAEFKILTEKGMIDVKF